MGKMIISWSPVHGQSATTTNIASLALLHALKYKDSNLITHTQLTFSSLESLFGRNIYADGFEDSGIAALERLSKSNLVRVGAIRDYTETVYTDLLHLLGGRRQFSSNHEQTQQLITTAARAYDYVWVDAHSGTNNKLTPSLMEESDLIIVNLPQNRYIIERFAQEKDYPEVLTSINHVYVISQYDGESSLSLKKIQRLLGTKQPVFGIPYSPQFKNAANALELPEYFYRNRDADMDRKNPSYDYVKAIVKINDYIQKATRKGKKELLEDEDE